MRHAEELLTDSKISITDIALASGFSSVSNFNRSFQMYNHCSPSQFRKKLMHV
ncbi:MAG: helix-turn-helix domain-containing protein [Blautia sp.]